MLCAVSCVLCVVCCCVLFVGDRRCFLLFAVGLYAVCYVLMLFDWFVLSVCCFLCVVCFVCCCLFVVVVWIWSLGVFLL